MVSPIQTERLTLRPVREADRAAIAHTLGNFEVSKWLARVAHPFGPDDVIISDQFPAAAAVDLDGRLIGSVRCVEDHLGYWFTPEVWGQGYGREAVGAMVARAMDATDIEGIASGVFEGNPASQRILIGHGFVETGRADEWCEARQARLPHIHMRLTRARWEALQ